MGTNRSGMPPKLEAVLGRLIQKLGPIDKTQAVKLPYLVDVVAKRVLGHAITGGTHQAWKFGVVTQEAYRGVEKSPNFQVQEIPYSEAQQSVFLIGKVPELAEEEREVVDFIADSFGKMPRRKLGTLTKRMNPEISDWGSNTPARVDEEAYLHMGRQWQGFLTKLEQQNLDDQSRWGAPITDPAAFAKSLFDA